ncbi:MAG: tRNA (guanosine(37)-N1)-methyltransferase TrmD [Eubacteriales bacterium]|nr:tRNA (guanosine(37)-N1)-methyltransferase TrmD [Eubacteriales bacterium]
MRIDILTLFPEMFSPLDASIIGRARKNGLLDIHIVNIRDFADNKHHQADDYPFGGGAGLVMMPQPIFDAMQSIDGWEQAHKVYMSPSGKTLTDARAREIARTDHLIVLCGHYEGVDQRVVDHLIDEEISIGDYVVTGGELPAMILIDCVSRFVSGVLGSSVSAEDESFSHGLLEYPQYTRPADFRGLKVPDVILSGHHANIEQWRREKQKEKTGKVRPDLLKEE